MGTGAEDLANNLDGAATEHSKSDRGTADVAVEAYQPITNTQTKARDVQHMNQSMEGSWLLPEVSITDTERQNDDTITPDIPPTNRRCTSHPQDYAIAAKHPGETADNVNAVSPNGVQQGDRGDCFFESSLASLANTPEGQAAIKNMVTTNGNGSYTVRFPGDKDHPIPVTEPDLQHPDSSENTNRRMAIIETAFMKYDHIGQYGSGLTSSPLSYQQIPFFGAVHTPAQALKLLTGKEASTNVIAGIAQNLDIGLTNPANLSGFMQNALRNGEPIVATSNLFTDAGPITSRHVYSVLGFDPATNQVTLRNPYGTGEVGKQIGGVTDLGDGRLTMSFNTFRKYFNNVTATGTNQIENQVINVANDLVRQGRINITAATALLNGNFDEAGEATLRAATNAGSTMVDAGVAVANTTKSLVTNALNDLLDWSL